MAARGSFGVWQLIFYSEDFILTFQYETEDVEARMRNINLFVYSQRHEVWFLAGNKN